MPHFRGNVGALGHREHLVERGDDLVRLGTLVRDVDAAMLPRDLRELDNLVGRRESPRHVLQRCAHPESALLHRLRHQRFHLIDFSGGGGALRLADHVAPQAARADKRADVERGAVALEPREVFAERAEVERHLEAVELRLRGFRERIVQRRDRRSFAGDLGGDALGDLAGGARVGQHVELRLAEHVDEARRDDEVGGIDAGLRLAAIEPADRGDAIAGDADVGAIPRRAAAIDHAAIGDQQIERVNSGRRRRNARLAGDQHPGDTCEQQQSASFILHDPPKFAGVCANEGGPRQDPM